MVRPLKRFSFTKIPCKYTCSQSNGSLRYRIMKRIKTFYNVIITCWGGKKRCTGLLSGTLIQIAWQIQLSYLNTYHFASIGIEWTWSRDSKEFVQVKDACCAAKITGNCAVNAAWRLGKASQHLHTGAEGRVLMLSLPSQAKKVTLPTPLTNAYFDMKM